MYKLVFKSFVISSVIFGGQLLSFDTTFGADDLNHFPNILMTPAMAKTQAIAHADAPQNEKPQVSDETINGKSFCISRIIIKARPERVWQVLSDYKHAVNVFPLLKKCEVLEDHGATKVAKHELAPSGVPDTFEYTIEIHESAPKMMEWRRLSGDFKEVDGSWKLEPINNGNCTLVTYASHVNGGFFMPQPLIRRQAHIDMPDTLMALKKHSEGTVQIASRRADTQTE